MLLGSNAVRISSDCGVDALVGGHIVVLPDSDYLLLVRLLAPDKSSAKTDLNWQEVVVEEVVEGGELLWHCDVATNAVEHRRTTDPWRAVGVGRGLLRQGPCCGTPFSMRTDLGKVLLSTKLGS